MNDVFETKPEKDDGEQTPDEAEDIQNTEDNEEKEQDNAEKEADKQEAFSVQFQKSVWNAILPTSAVEKSLSEDERKARTTVKKTTDVSRLKGKEKQGNESEEDKLSDTDEEKASGTSLEDAGVSEEQENTSEAGETDRTETVTEEDDAQTVEKETKQDEGEQEPEEAEQEVVADAGYFTVRGSMRTNVEAFVGDITIEPTGIDGFD